ncbi:nucleotidyltransferase [Streptomyces sp. NPDC033538]|uniref:nucleotidyltransferase domain-containing protein n=1 Tax=Streptomyces sp. NPDC033538 TaxID=3155367 RepID=UPI0033CF26F1
MTLEEKLSGWTGPSSATEQDKQDRTERMIREAIKEHAAFDGCDLSVYAKGSYANNTNVKADSDVDIAVQCGEAVYWDEATKGTHPPSGSYEGIWTPAKLRAELETALKAKFPSQVDSSGSTAFRIHSSSARVDADVVPCFDYRYYFSSSNYREGAKVFKKNGNSLVNYPKQQLENGRAKNTRSKQYYKKAVRIMKRVENAMVAEGIHREVPSFFVECLVYNCPDSVFLEATWTRTVEGIILHIWQELEGDEPSTESERWLEVSECKYLFHGAQDWNRQDGRDFVKAAWNYLGYAS